MRLELKTATVAIRGTDFWSMSDAVHDAVCLFEGKVDVVTTEQGLIALDKPTAFYARFFDKPLQPAGVATQDELAKFLASTELQAGQGVATASGRWRVVAASLPTAPAASQMATRLREKGYPASVRNTSGKSYEVRINGFISTADAQTVLGKINTQSGLSGKGARVALAASAGKS